MSRRDGALDALTEVPRAYLQTLLDCVPAALVVVDRNGLVKYASGQLQRFSTRSFPDLVGHPIGALVKPGDMGTVEELIGAAAGRPDGQVVGPVRVSYLDDTDMPRASQAWAVNYLSEPIVGGVVVLVLPESANERFEQAVEAISIGTPNERIFGWLAQALRYPPVESECYFLTPARDDRGVLRSPDLPGVPGPPATGPWDDVWMGDHVVHHPNLSLLSPSLRQAAGEAGLRAMSCFGVHQRGDGRYDACLVVWRHREGPLSSFATAAISRAIAIASLALAHASEEAGVRDAALRDPLTGLENRHGFFQALDSRTAAGDRPTILCIDLDGFREVNERLGHLAGDAVLRVVARRLAAVMRPTDDLARLGGDEFAVLCGGQVTKEQAGAIATRVIKQLARPLAVGEGETMDIGASIGIAMDHPAGTAADTLLGKADHALYAAKTKGRGHVVIASG